MFVTTSLMRGGAETQVYLLARSLQALGYDVHIVSLRDPEAYVAELAADGIALTSLGMSKGIPDPRGFARLLKLIRRWRPEIVHSHMVHANLLTRLARRFTTMPVQISTLHNLEESSRWRYVAYRLTDRWCDLSTNVCAAGVEEYVRAGAVPPHKIIQVPNGLDVSRFEHDDAVRSSVRDAQGAQERFVWIAVGRLEAPKDYRTLLDAIAMLQRDQPDMFDLWIVGDGSLRTDVEAWRTGLGSCQHRVHLLLDRDDVPKLLSAADGYVMSSSSEGLPLVLLEAASASLPIVATDVGGNREVVVDGVNGWLCAPRQAAALAARMAQVMRAPAAERGAMGIAGRRHVETTYDITRVVSRWEQVYASMDPHQGPSAHERRAGA